MLYQINRLRKKKDFEAVFKKGKIIKADFLYIKFFRNNLDCSRIGFVVSKKVSNKAVVRNLIKRRLRNAARLKIGVVKNGFDIVFVALPAVKNKTHKETSEEIQKIFQSAELLENSHKSFQE